MCAQNQSGMAAKCVSSRTRCLRLLALPCGQWLNLLVPQPPQMERSTIILLLLHRLLRGQQELIHVKCLEKKYLARTKCHLNATS